jgi:hypothetical protein
MPNLCHGIFVGDEGLRHLAVSELLCLPLVIGHSPTIIHTRAWNILVVQSAAPSTVTSTAQVPRWGVQAHVAFVTHSPGGAKTVINRAVHRACGP